jgi:hypothetical protein
VRRFQVPLFTLATLTLSALPALAEDTTCRAVSDGHGGRVIECDAQHIEADVPRPFVILPGRSAFDYEAPPLERELAREIRRTVRRTPF